MDGSTKVLVVEREKLKEVKKRIKDLKNHCYQGNGFYEPAPEDRWRFSRDLYYELLELEKLVKQELVSAAK